jgi:hypothetical protein
MYLHLCCNHCTNFIQQRVSEISTLILTSDRSHQEQQTRYVPFFRNKIFVSVLPPIN